MSVEWTKQTFQGLEKSWLGSDAKPSLSDDENARIGRYGEIMCIMESDRIWPVTGSRERVRFCAALCEVLSRLPQEAFDEVDAHVGFVFDEPALKMFAVNVPASPAPSSTIVFFRTCMQFTSKALIGLIAHEIAHCFVDAKEDMENEKLTNEKVREWGFGPELECEDGEKKQLYPKRGGTVPVTGQSD